VDETMRTAPVVELTQPEILVETGAARAADPIKRETAKTLRVLRSNMETSKES
jgi:hypothetical protein